MGDWVYPPQHDAVEVAARLRTEIEKRRLQKIEIEERRARVADRFQEQIDMTSSAFEQERFRSDWAGRNQEFRSEIAGCEAAHSELRRLLQWLTGELWS